MMMVMMMRHSLTVHPCSPAFKHPLGPSEAKWQQTFGLSCMQWLLAFRHFCWCPCSPSISKQQSGGRSGIFEGTVVALGLISVRCLLARCHHHVYEPSAHFQETLDCLAWLFRAVGFFPFSHTFASPQKSSGWPAWNRFRQKQEAEAGNSSPQTIPWFFQGNFPPLTISEDFLLCPSSASYEALAGRTKRQLYMLVTGWSWDWN